MDYALWQKQVDAALEAGFLNSGMSCEQHVSLDDLPADDAVAAIEASMADRNEAIEAFKGIVEIEHWAPAQRKVMREAQIDALLRTLTSAVEAHIREQAESPMFALLGRLVAGLVYDQIEPGLTGRITALSSDWDEAPVRTDEHWLDSHREAATDSRGAP